MIEFLFRELLAGAAAEYLISRIQKPLAWIQTFGAVGLTAGAVCGFLQGGLEGAVVGGFVGGTVGAGVGMIPGLIVWLAYRMKNWAGWLKR